MSLTHLLITHLINTYKPQPTKAIDMVFSGTLLACHSDKWTSPLLHLFSSSTTFISTHLRLYFLRSSHAPTHLHLSTMDSQQIHFFLPPSVVSSLTPLSVNSLSEEERPLVILVFGEGILLTTNPPLLQFFQAPLDTLVDYVHNGDNRSFIQETCC